jgi:hypothetical protein
MHWIHLAQDREQWKTYEHFNEPSVSINCWEFLERFRLLKKDSARWF